MTEKDEREWVREKARDYVSLCLSGNPATGYAISCDIKSLEDQFEAAILSAYNKGLSVGAEREETIQSLLRHAFRCCQKSKCNCSKRIQAFLTTDKQSLEYAAEIKAKMIKEEGDIRQ